MKATQKQTLTLDDARHRIALWLAGKMTLEHYAPQTDEWYGLVREGDAFVLYRRHARAPYGNRVCHYLSVAHTDLNRLAAHYAGFCAAVA